MIKIKIKPVEQKPVKTYRVIDVAKALGVSENSVYGYFNNRKVSVKNGVTIEQVAECATHHALSKERKTEINWNEVAEMREILNEKYGLEITKTLD